MTRAWYRPVDPPEDLARVLACSWTAVPSGIHRLTPDGCLDLLWIDDGTFVLCGPERRSWRFRLPEGRTAVGVRFRPGLAGVALDLDVSELVDRRVAVATVVGAERAAAAQAALVRHRSLDRRRRELVDHVRTWVAGVQPDPRAEALLDLLVARPGATQPELAAELAISVRSLHRLAARRFGYGTATLARILRLQRLLALADASPERTLATLAAEAGYTDQAHLSSDCRAITGLTPTRFVAEWFPTFPDMADPYKTDAPLAVSMAS